MSNWYYTQEDEPVGPISAQQLKQLAHDGAITADSLVWKSGMGQWKLAAAVKGLVESAPPLPTSPPPLSHPDDESPASAPAEPFPAPITTPATTGRKRTRRRKTNPAWVAIGSAGVLFVIVAIVVVVGFGGKRATERDDERPTVAATESSPAKSEAIRREAGAQSEDTRSSFIANDSKTDKLPDSDAYHARLLDPEKRTRAELIRSVERFVGNGSILPLSRTPDEPIEKIAERVTKKELNGDQRHWLQIDPGLLVLTEAKWAHLFGEITIKPIDRSAGSGFDGAEIQWISQCRDGYVRFGGWRKRTPLGDGFVVRWAEFSMSEAQMANSTSAPRSNTTRSSEPRQVEPPLPIITYLSDLQEFGVQVQRNWFFKKGRLFTTRIMFNGEPSQHGLLTHPPGNGFAKVRYSLGGKYDRFQTTVAIPRSDQPSHADQRNPASPLTFIVLADGSEIWRSPALSRIGQSSDCDVNISGTQQLELRVRCPGANNWAFAAWIDPRLTQRE